MRKENRKIKEMKATVKLNIDKYLKKQIETGFYLDIDRLGTIWLCHEENGVKHWTIASDDELKEWGIENLEFSI